MLKFYNCLRQKSGQMHFSSFLTVALFLASAALAPATAAASGTAAAAAPAATRVDATPSGCPALLHHSFDRLQDEKPQTLCQYAGKVLLVVNTASYCGFTGQYAGLEKLYARYKDKGLVVLGFPSNDFAQESDNNGKIADFCENTYGVKFPMFAKSAVSGDAASPFYQALAKAAGQAPRWNFYKYLIGRDGRLVDYYVSTTTPDSSRLVKALEQALAQPAPKVAP